MKLTEAQVQAHILEARMEALTRHEPDLEVEVEAGKADDEEASFELWRLVKAKALSKLDRLHTLIRYGQFIGSALRLPSGSTHMELDILRKHEDGLFVLELKVNKTAERQAFSELLAYSDYIANVFCLSGPKDIANVLVANLENQITRQAFLYDLLIADRNTLVYTQAYPDGTLDFLELRVHVPSDEDFKKFTNNLISHDAMSCVVATCPTGAA